MNIAPFTCETLERSFEEVGIEASVYTDYSGRGMYGATCFGIVTSESPAMVALVIVDAVRTDHWEQHSEDNHYAVMEIATEIVRAAREDSMGLDRITYFPGWTLTKS